MWGKVPPKMPPLHKEAHIRTESGAERDGVEESDTMKKAMRWRKASGKEAEMTRKESWQHEDEQAAVTTAAAPCTIANSPHDLQGVFGLRQVQVHSLIRQAVNLRGGAVGPVCDEEALRHV